VHGGTRRPRAHFERRWLFVGWIVAAITWSGHAWNGAQTDEGATSRSRGRERGDESPQPPKPPPRPEPAQTDLCQQALVKATEQLSEARARGAGEWEQRARLYEEAGRALVTDCTTVPDHLERGIDSLIAATDELYPNGRESKACELYREAIPRYRQLLSMIGPGKMEQRVTRKLKIIERQLQERCDG
jgi:hypothetical protein